MFFEISQNLPPTWPYRWIMGSWHIGTDAGWAHWQNRRFECIYKGYAESQPLTTVVERVCMQEHPGLLGNFCVLVWDRQLNLLSIKTDKYRSFPIYIQDEVSVTNLFVRQHTAWSDSLVTIDHGLRTAETKFDIIGDTAAAENDIDWIHHRLQSRIQDFANHNTLPIRVFLSGGVDTLLIYSYLVALDINCEIVNGLHFEFDEFWLGHSGEIKKFWAYSQLHHWRDPCVLVSGAPGDEFMLRSPTTANLWLQNHGTNIPAELANRPDCLHHAYFSQPKHLELFRQQCDQRLDNQGLCNIVVNDWQHWHLGNTTTWTPLRDLEIFKVIINLPCEQVVSQIFNSDISRTLIERNVPGLSRCISNQKNHGNVYANLRDIVL